MTQPPIVPGDGENLVGQWNSPPPTPIQHTVSGFTPVFDHLARKFGLVRAAVYGRMWRYCQMEDGVCNASLETISGDIGLDKATVQRHAEELVKDGYLKDTTPAMRNKPHTYVDAGKVRMVSATTAGPTVAQRNVGVAQRNVGVAHSNATVAESRLKKVLKKDSKKLLRAENHGAESEQFSDLFPERKPSQFEKGPHTPEEARARIATALQSGGENGAAAWVPEPVRGLALAFTAATGLTAGKGERGAWVKQLTDLAGAGITPEAVGRAVEKMNRDGLTIARPASVLSVARSMQAHHAEVFIPTKEYY